MISSLPHMIRALLFPVFSGVLIVLLLPLLAGYIVLLERKIMADMRTRRAPPSECPHGLLQPIADALKLPLKEDIIPRDADTFLFWFAPLMSVTVALVAFAALPFGPSLQIADLDAGLLFILAVGSLGIYGIVLGGWAANSCDSLHSALCRAARLVSFETAAALGLVSALLLAGTLSMKGIVQAQYDQGTWFIFYAPIGFFIFLAGSIAEVNRAPFDWHEGESKLAGSMTEYGGFRWFLYFLADYANMIIVAGIATTLFLGGWLRPFPSIHDHLYGTQVEVLDAFPALLFLAAAAYCLRLIRRQPAGGHKIGMALMAGLCVTLAGVMAGALFAPPAVMAGIHGAFWFLAKIVAFLYAFLWFRFTFPRSRFDQLMRLAWRFLIPLGIVNVMGVAVAIELREEFGFSPWWSNVLIVLLTLGAALWLMREMDETRERAVYAEGAGR
ncbi:MAG: complex I subunit 1/NuoH family protein [Candidatus Acidiferrales bacterium]